jgi:hypothetical protein
MVDTGKSQFQWCRREYSWKNLGGGIVETDKALFFDWFQSLYGFDLQMYMYLGDQLRKLIIISTYKIRLRMKIRLKKLQLRCLVFQ